MKGKFILIELEESIELGDESEETIGFSISESGNSISISTDSGGCVEGIMARLYTFYDHETPAVDELLESLPCQEES